MTGKRTTKPAYIHEPVKNNGCRDIRVFKYAALLLHISGKKIDENGIKAILTAAGLCADEMLTKEFIVVLETSIRNSVVEIIDRMDLVTSTKEDEETGMAGLGALFP